MHFGMLWYELKTQKHMQIDRLNGELQIQRVH